MQAPSSISVSAARGLISNAENFGPVSCEMCFALGLSQDAEGLVSGEPGVYSALGYPRVLKAPCLASCEICSAIGLPRTPRNLGQC